MNPRPQNGRYRRVGDTTAGVWDAATGESLVTLATISSQ